MEKIRNYIVIVSFALIVGFFFLNQVHPFVPDAEYKENKQKAEKPSLNIKKLDYYPRKYEQYLSDHFSQRGTLLTMMGKINTDIWEKSPKPDQIILGRDNWLYIVDKELDCYYGKRNFSQKQLEEVLAEFQYRKEILDTMGIQMYIVIHPTKYSIYPEYLPSYLISPGIVNSATQLVNYFNENSNIDIFYSKDLLLSLKEKYQLYYKNDNHWNSLAAYYVAKEITRKVNPGLPEIRLNDFCGDTIYNHRGNLAYMTGNPDSFLETIVQFTKCKDDAKREFRITYDPPASFPYKESYQLSFNSGNENFPNALIIRDSYAEALIPYLKNSFYHSTFIWDDWRFGFNLEIIEQEKPDVVIYMILESFIPNIYTWGMSEKY